jgi:hypothetical protein
MSQGVVICRHFEPEVRAALEAEGLGGLTVALFRGACEGRLPEAPTRDRVDGMVRLSGDCAGLAGPSTGFDTCFSMLIGQALADEFLGQGLHLLTPSMARAWSEVRRRWGFTEDQVRACFGESIHGFRIIDCGVCPPAPQDIETIARETGLPVDVWAATLDHLRSVLRRVLRPPAQDPAPSSEPRLLSDYAMAYDLLGRMVPLEDEDQVSREIANLFLMLCAPGRVVLDLEARGSKPARRLTLPEGMEGAPAWVEPLGTFELELRHEGTRLGTLRVEDLAFPAQRNTI